MGFTSDCRLAWWLRIGAQELGSIERDCTMGEAQISQRFWTLLELLKLLSYWSCWSYWSSWIRPDLGAT